MNLSSLLSEGVALFDGAMGTMLAASGAPIEGCVELLTVTHPEIIANVHRAYLDAGAQIVETCSLGSNRVKLSKYGLEHRAAELTQRAVRVARQAVGDKALVALSAGTTGDFLKPLGSLSFEQIYDAFYEVCRAGAEAGADLIFFETMMDLREGRIALLAARDAADLPVCLSMTYTQGGRTLMGDTPECAANLAGALNAAMVGANCSGGPDELLPVLNKMRGVSSVPLVIQPNAGLPQIVNNMARHTLDADGMLEKMRAVLSGGAGAIGGCCGTTPDHIKKLHALIKGAASPEPVPQKKRISSTRFIAPLDAPCQSLSFPAGCDPYDIADELSMLEADRPVMLDVSALGAKEIENAVDILQQSAHNPLKIKVGGADCALSALKNYHGVLGVSCERDAKETAEYARKYGAHIIGA